MRDAARFLARLWAMEAALVESGLPGIPGDWWKREIEAFYRSGKRRWTVRKGRRVFASTAVAPRLAVAEMLFGEHEHIRGTPPLEYVFLSVRRDEAAGRVFGVEQVLNALGVKYRPAGQGVHGLVLEGLPAMFRVLTANHRAAVGGTVAFAWCDEVSRWNDDKTGKNPADEVIAALNPALTTLPDAKMFLVSSPLTTGDFHATSFAEGESDRQHISFGETWVINPDFTEEQTHKEEPNLRKWTREFAAIPVDGIENDWFGAAVDAAFLESEILDVRNGMQPLFTIDPAFSKHHFGFAVTTSEPVANDNARRLTLVHDSGAWIPDGEPRRSLERLRDTVLVPYMHKAGRDSETLYVHTDQAEFHSLRDVARSVGITLLCVPWTGGDGETSKLARFRQVRTAMLGDDVRIQAHWSSPEGRKRLIAQFRSVAGVITPAGNERIVLREDENGHCDELSAVVQGISIVLERPPVAARPLVAVRTKDTPDDWRLKAEREVNEKRRREWKRSPTDVLRRAMR